jgi:hypothetical protein
MRPPYLNFLGEYVAHSRDGVSTETHAARQELIRATVRVVPEFFTSLRELQSVFTRYQKLVKGWPPFWHPAMSYAEWEAACDEWHKPGGDLHRTTRFSRPLLAWVTKFHADQQVWILEGALEALRYLLHHDFESPSSVASVFGKAFHVSLATKPFQFIAEGWQPQTQMWTSYRSTLLKKFEAAAASYEKRIRVTADAVTPRARKKWSVNHFEWFAMCQFGDEQPAVLARERSLDRGDNTTVTKALKSVATLVGWRGPVRHVRSYSGK